MNDTPAPATEIRFEDGAAYEAFMGVWSRLAGEVFLDWLAPRPGARWLDVGCGNGAFTELIAARAAPTAVHGIDPSPQQIDYARSRAAAAGGPPRTFDIGDAQALPYADDAFDASVMALVIFFVPDPRRGVEEMARVTRPGGSVCAYAWDILGGGFPYAALQEEMAALGIPTMRPPSVEAARIDALRALWSSAGLVDVETREIRVERSYDDFESYWAIAQTGPRIAPLVSSMSQRDAQTLQRRLRDRLPPGTDGRITCAATCNAVKGRVPR